MKPKEIKKLQKLLKSITKLCDKAGEEYLAIFVTNASVSCNNRYWESEDDGVYFNSYDRGETWKTKDV